MTRSDKIQVTLTLPEWLRLIAALCVSIAVGVWAVSSRLAVTETMQVELKGEAQQNAKRLDDLQSEVRYLRQQIDSTK